MISIFGLGPILTLVILGILIVIALKFGKSIVWLAVNSLIGLILLVVLNFLPFVNITINIWSILIVVFGGVAGVALLLLLDLLKLAF